MKARYIHEGNSIDYTPAYDTPAGTVVVQGELIGIACRDIKAQKLGALAVAGVFDFPKTTGRYHSFYPGELCYWNEASQQVAHASTGNKLIGKSVAHADEASTTVRIRMTQ